MLTTRQTHYFDTTIKNQKIKETISSPKEYEFMNVLADMGYREGIDYTHQFACCNEEMGKVFIADFGFPKEKVLIELDGKNHRYKKQKEADYLRDNVFNLNGYEVIRIPQTLDEYDYLFWKFYVQETINEKRKIYERKMD